MKLLFSSFLLAFLLAFLATVTNARYVKRAAELSDLHSDVEKRAAEEEVYAKARVGLDFTWLLPEENDILNNATLLIEELNKGHGETPVVIHSKIRPQGTQNPIPSVPASGIITFDPPESIQVPEPVPAEIPEVQKPIVDEKPQVLPPTIPEKPQVLPPPIPEKPQVLPPPSVSAPVNVSEPKISSRFSLFGLSFGNTENIEPGANTSTTVLPEVTPVENIGTGVNISTTILPEEKDVESLKSDEPGQPDEETNPPLVSPDVSVKLPLQPLLPIPEPEPEPEPKPTPQPALAPSSISIPILNVSENAAATNNESPNVDEVEHPVAEPEEISPASPESTVPPTEAIPIPTELPSGILIENEEQVISGAPVPDDAQEVFDIVEVQPPKAPEPSSEESDESSEEIEKSSTPTIPPTEAVEQEKEKESPDVDTSVKIIAGRESLTENVDKDIQKRFMFDTIADWFGGGNKTAPPPAPPSPELPENSAVVVASPPRDVRDEIPVENKTVTFVPTTVDVIQLFLIPALTSNVSQPYPPPKPSPPQNPDTLPPSSDSNSNSTNVDRGLQQK